MSYIAVASIGTSVVMGLVSGNQAKKEAENQRELQRQALVANLTSQEKQKFEELKLLGETERTKIMADSNLSYRVALQEASTQRLKDTWIYVAGSGLGISFIYGVVLVGGSYKKG